MKRRTALMLMLCLAMTGCAPQIPAATAPETKEEAPSAEEEKAEPEKEPIEEEEEEAVDADELFMEYLKGNVKDTDGNEFTGRGMDTEFALIDLNGDGQNEMALRSDGVWIFDIYACADGKVVMSGVESIGSSGLTIINTKNQYVAGDTGHVSRNQFFVWEIGENGRAEEVLYFSNFWDDWAESGEPEFYKVENPSPDQSSVEDFEPISEEEYNALRDEYLESNKQIKWTSVRTVTDPDGTEDSGSSEVSAAAADEKLMGYLKGEEKDAEGAFFQPTEDDTSIEYTFHDLNGDGLDELIIRRLNKWDSLWVPEVIQYRDGRIEKVLKQEGYASSFINTKGQYVDTTADVIDNICYWVSEIGEDGMARLVIYFIMYYDEGDGAVCYKSENPVSRDFPVDPPVTEITEAEFEALSKEYGQEDTSLVWTKLF